MALENQAVSAGLRINGQKTKVVRIGYVNSRVPFIIDGKKVEEVANFTYLGSVVSSNGDAERDVFCCIGKASAVFQRLRPIWNSPSLSLQIKLRLLATIVVPAATYACETWKMTETIARKLDVFHLRCLRRILKITYRDHITNMEVYRRAYTQPLSVTVTERRFRFAGHILRLPDHRILKMAISWQPAQGKRKQGRPKITW